MSQTVELSVKGMSCHHCEMAVTKALKALSGVSEASADHKAGQAVVKIEPSVSREALLEAIRKAGYEAS